MIRRRSSDNGEDEGYKNRSLIDLKTIILIISFLVGGGAGTVGLDILTPNEADKRITAVETRLENYVQSHAKDEEWQEKILHEKLKNLEDKIDQMKASQDRTNYLLQKLNNQSK